MSENQNVDYYKRFVEASENGLFSSDEELKVLTFLLEKYNPLTISEYSRKINKTPACVSKRIKSGKESYIQIGKLKYII